MCKTTYRDKALDARGLCAVVIFLLKTFLKGENYA
jgi:hypothetical protein